eukprot:11400009-Ditylum_brightwellii.AAC.1
MVVVAVGRLCPTGACKGTRQLIVAFYWLCLYLDMADSNNGNDNYGNANAYGTKNGVNVLFQCQSPPSI